MHNSQAAQVLSFVRQNDKDKVFAVFNFSDSEQQVSFKAHLHHGKYTEYLSGETAEFGTDTRLTLPAWGYRIYVKN